MTKEQQRIVEDNINLVHHLLKKYQLSKYDYQDCFQAGSIGLCLAVQRFDSNRKTAFSTYASIVIEGYIKVLIRDFLSGPIRPKRDYKSNNFERPQYLYIDGVINKDSDLINGNDFIELQESREEEIIAELELEKIKNKLSAKENKLVNLMMQGTRQNDIARELGVSQPQVSRIRKSVKIKVKDYMGVR